MIEWRHNDSFTMGDGRTVYTGPYPFDCPRSEAVGQIVLHDGTAKTVLGVEWFSVPREPSRGEPVGLLFT